MRDSVGVVLVNWHGAPDTVACVRSLCTSVTADADVDVFVVDNASTDGSVAQIAAALLADGWQPAAGPASTDARVAGTTWYTSPTPALRRLALLHNHANLGFAAANNIGYALARQAGGAGFVWLLNNDTEVRPDTLQRHLDRLHAQPNLGMCGCTIVYFDDPGTIQCSGGVRYFPVSGRGRLMAAGRPLAEGPTNAEAEEHLDFVNGASMFLRGDAIDRIGPMAEDYFLYNEELDWAYRARGHFRLGVETSAVVLHKEGATIGTATARQRPSALANFFQTRSKLIFARKFTPWWLPTIWLTLLARCAKQALRGDVGVSLIILQVLLGRRQPSAEWFRRRRGPAPADHDTPDAKALP